MDQIIWTCINTYIQTDMHLNNYTYIRQLDLKQIDGLERDKKTDKHTDRQKDINAHRQRDSPTNINTDIHRQTNNKQKNRV